jgi:predicted nuclease of predicted toxin-antitoxin system
MAQISFYFDEMMSRRAADQLMQRGIQVVMANDVGMTKQPDEAHLAYATEHDLVLVTFDRPFAGRTMKTTEHAGLICLSGEQDDVGGIVHAVENFANQYLPENAAGQVFWI